MAGNIPPQPMGLGVLKIHKLRQRNWEASGGVPPVYGPPPTAAITIGAINTPATSPVSVTGSIAPPGYVDGAVFNGANMVVPWTRAVGSMGTFGAQIPIPVGTGYTIHVRQANLTTNIQTSNTFDVE